jgi:predicted transposase/invertase (TIGR01784 family)
MSKKSSKKDSKKEFIEEEIEMKEEVIKTEIFADPTYDAGFKILFNTKGNEKILKSFLNDLLDFKGDEQIKIIELVNPILPQSTINSIDSTVDVRCIRENGEEISIEMQRRNEKYFLPRTQSYMAKMMHDQVKVGEGSKYHEVMKKNYILVIALKKLFTESNKLPGDDDAHYEKTIVPMCKELKVEIPYNKMYWKFFELDRFKNHYKGITIDKKSEEKDQWLDFLLNCGGKQDIPDNINDIIKEGYEAMKIKTLQEKKLADMYWNAKAREDSYDLQNQELKEEYLMKGKLKGEIKGEISKIKNFIELEVPQEKFAPKLHFLNEEKFKINLDFNLSYIKEHLEDTESAIGEHLNLFDKMDIEHHS